MTSLEKQLRDFKKQGKSLKYLISYMLRFEQYDETDVLNMMIWLKYPENEIIETLEYDFSFDMSWHPMSVIYKEGVKTNGY